MGIALRILGLSDWTLTAWFFVVASRRSQSLSEFPLSLDRSYTLTSHGDSGGKTAQAQIMDEVTPSQTELKCIN